jgi:hypothetical protein
MEQGISSFLEAFLTVWIRLECSSKDPWERLKRAIFIPALITRSITSGVSVAGPRVQTILVLRAKRPILGIVNPPIARS